MSDEDHGGAEFFLTITDEVEDLLLNGNIKGSRRLVTNQEFGAGDEGHRDHDTLAHAAGKFMGVRMDAFGRIWNADFGERINGAVESKFAVAVLVNGERFCQLRADLHERVEGSHRVLEDHRDALTTDFAELAFGDFQKINAAEKRLPAVNATGRLRDQPKQGLAGDGLARARFPDDSECLPGIDLE